MTDINALKSELSNFYRHVHPEQYRKNIDEANAVLEREMPKTVSSYEMKALQYELLSELYTPVLFENTPFWFELCSLSPTSGPTSE